MDPKRLLLIVSVIGIILAMFIFQQSPTPNTETACSTDTDCVPAESCHPTTCINEEFKVYSEVYCTTDCAPGTLDCGQGSFACVNNVCGVIMNEQ